MNQRCNRRTRRAGAVLVEAALVLPLVFLFIFGVMEYSRYLMTLHVFTNAAGAGAAYAARHTSPIVLNATTYGNADSDVLNVVNTGLAGQTLSGQNTSIYLSDAVGNNLGTWTNAQAGQYVCVQITGTYSFMLPTLLGLPSTLSQTYQSVKVSEGN
jgi:Flp pilus assembly protein TadG